MSKARGSTAAKDRKGLTPKQSKKETAKARGTATLKKPDRYPVVLSIPDPITTKIVLERVLSFMNESLREMAVKLDGCVNALRSYGIFPDCTIVQKEADNLKEGMRREFGAPAVLDMNNAECRKQYEKCLNPSSWS